MKFSSFLRKTIWIAAALPLTIAANTVLRAEALPLTPEAIDEFVQSAEEAIAQEIKTIVSLPDDQNSHQQFMRSWNQLGIDILGRLSVLAFLSHQEVPSKERAILSLPKLVGNIFESLVLNPAPYQSYIGYAERSLVNAAGLDPYFYYEIQSILESCEAIRFSLSKEDQARLRRVKALCAKKEKQPFLYLRGEAVPKSSSNNEFSVFCLNTCFQPGFLPGYIFGGVSPWKERMPKLADAILSADADVVCLQEMHGFETGYALYEKLKEKYAHFYISIGPRVIGFSYQTLGFPSGLFVASNWPIENPRFTLFPESGFPMNYGYFDFILKNDEAPIGHVYTTHMQSLNQENFSEIREKQFLHILETMERDFQKNPELAIPYFLCGDLNVPYGSGEPSEVHIRTYFYDAYNHNRMEVRPEDRTCTDHFSQHYLTAAANLPSMPICEILDYALLLKTLPSCLCRTFDTQYRMKTLQIPMNTLTDPSSAISDHHALLTTISENPSTP